MVRLKEEIAGKEKISNEHKRTISDLKQKSGKQLVQTLKDENDSLNKESTTQTKYRQCWDTFWRWSTSYKP